MLRTLIGNLGHCIGYVPMATVVAWIFGASPETAVQMIGGALLAGAARTGWDLAAPA